jgi:CBS domain-containing protein
MTTPLHGGRVAPPDTLDDPPITALMTPRVIAITPDAPLCTALRLMAIEQLRHLPVLDGERCLGMIGETDLVHAVAVGGPPLVGALVRPVPALPGTARRSTAARTMVTAESDAVLVMDEERLVGILTATDLVVSLAAAPGLTADR